VWVGRPRLTLLLMRGACCLQTGMFKHVDACYSLAFATMMLQTALHNPQAGRSMNLESFTRLNLNMNCRTSDMGDIHPTWDPEDRWVGGAAFWPSLVHISTCCVPSHSVYGDPYTQNYVSLRSVHAPLCSQVSERAAYATESSHACVCACLCVVPMPTARFFSREFLEEVFKAVAASKFNVPGTEGGVGYTFMNPDKEGYLYKQGGSAKRWAKRWIVVKAGCLYYFASEEVCIFFFFFFFFPLASHVSAAVNLRQLLSAFLPCAS
jgi:hypothetical protein